MIHENHISGKSPDNNVTILCMTTAFFLGIVFSNNRLSNCVRNAEHFMFSGNYRITCSAVKKNVLVPTKQHNLKWLRIKTKTRRHINLKTKDLIAEAISLPVEERTIVVDSILKSLNPPTLDIDRKWAAVGVIKSVGSMN